MDIKKVYSHIKSLGYSISKDDLGTYFDIEGRKLSIIKTGTWFTCYHNVRANNAWNLVGKSQILDKYELAMNWVTNEIEKNK